MDITPLLLCRTQPGGAQGLALADPRGLPSTKTACGTAFRLCPRKPGRKQKSAARKEKPKAGRSEAD